MGLPGPIADVNVTNHETVPHASLARCACAADNEPDYRLKVLCEKPLDPVIIAGEPWKSVAPQRLRWLAVVYDAPVPIQTELWHRACPGAHAAVVAGGDSTGFPAA